MAQEESQKNIRTRNWFLTINPNAECYNNISKILSNLKINKYAYIFHDKADNDNENINHIHLCLELSSAKTFTSMQSIFVGAHISVMKYKNQCYKYLIHLSEETGESEYSTEKVITNDKDYYLYLISTDEFFKLDSQSIITDIRNNGFFTITQFLEKYGMYQVKQFLPLIKEIMKETSINYSSILDKMLKLEKENADLKIKNQELERLLDKELPF